MQDYPGQLADLVKEHWVDIDSGVPSAGGEESPTKEGLPCDEMLRRLIATCFEGSLLRDEDRAVRFRLMLRDPRQLAQDEESSAGLQHLVFSDSIPLESNELRRLAQAAPFDRALIGVRADPRGHLEIWGIVHSGSDWLRALEGGRCLSHPLPPSLVISVIGPGHLSLARGSELICGLVGGKLAAAPPAAIFVADPSTGQASAESDLFVLHEQARRRAREPWATLDSSLVRVIRQSLALRLISAIRQGRHGGTILFVPRRMAQRPTTLDRYVRVKYRFSSSASQRRFYDLLVRLMNALAVSYGVSHGSEKVVGWNEYATSCDPHVIEIDQALNEQVHLLAGLAAADGAVVLARPLGIVGFGGEICGRLKHVDMVARALDREGSRVEQESTSGVGTRHRSVYRLCNSLPTASAIVVSQDGGVRIVRQMEGNVTYWEQLPGDVFGSHGRAVFPAQNAQFQISATPAAKNGARGRMV